MIVQVLSRIRERPWLVGAMAACLAVQGLIAARAHLQTPVLGPDGVDFMRVSKLPLTSDGLWLGRRAPVFPLFVRLVDHDVEAVVDGHLLLAGLAWFVLGLVLASRMQTVRGRAFMFLAVLLVSATAQVTLWNSLVLAESLALSLVVLGTALAFLVLRRWTWPRLAATALVAVLIVLVRDSHALLGLAVAGVVVLACALRAAPPRALLLAAALVPVSLFTMHASSEGDRYLQSIHQVVRDRVLASESATAWFEERGLPDAELVRSPAGDDLVRMDAFWADRRLAPYFDWLREHGRSTLLSYVARHPGFLFQGPYLDPATWAGPTPSVREYEMYTGTEPALGELLNRILWPESPWVVYPAQALALVAGTAVLLRDRSRRVLAGTGVASIVLGMALVAVAANLATAETARHAIVQVAMTRIGILCVVGAALESLLTSRPSVGRPAL